MSAIERALAQQHLQLEAARQRETLAGHVKALQPIFDAADRVRAGTRWLGQHPEVLAGGLAFLAVTRPGVRRLVWRWGRRALFAWGLWRDHRRWLQQSP